MNYLNYFDKLESNEIQGDWRENNHDSLFGCEGAHQSLFDQELILTFNDSNNLNSPCQILLASENTVQELPHSVQPFVQPETPIKACISRRETARQYQLDQFKTKIMPTPQLFDHSIPSPYKPENFGLNSETNRNEAFSDHPYQNMKSINFRDEKNDHSVNVSQNNSTTSNDCLSTKFTNINQEELTQNPNNHSQSMRSNKISEAPKLIGKRISQKANSKSRSDGDYIPKSLNRRTLKKENKLNKKLTKLTNKEQSRTPQKSKSEIPKIKQNHPGKKPNGNCAFPDEIEGLESQKRSIFRATFKVTRHFEDKILEAKEYQKAFKPDYVTQTVKELVEASKLQNRIKSKKVKKSASKESLLYEMKSNLTIPQRCGYRFSKEVKEKFFLENKLRCLIFIDYSDDILQNAMKNLKAHSNYKENSKTKENPLDSRIQLLKKAFNELLNEWAIPCSLGEKLKKAQA